MSSQGSIPTLRRMRPMLGTFVEIGIFEPDARAAEAVVAAFAEVERVHRLMSFQSRDSELTRLNLAGGQWVNLSDLTLRALRLARAMTRSSAGLFNCTVAGTLIARGRLPDHDGRDCLAVGTADDLEIGAGGACLKRGARITLDGIAKGLAVDRALARLRLSGVRNAWVNAGGDLRVVGRHGLPVRMRGGAQGFLLHNGALATSTNARRFEPSMPGEITDLRGRAPTGEWSVVAACAWRADALTKVAALATDDQRDGLLRRLGGRLVDSRSLDACAA